MIKFDRTKLAVTRHLLKRVTTALGGAITLVNPEEEAEAEAAIAAAIAAGATELEARAKNKTKGTRIEIPFAVARQFIKLTKFTQYPKPVEIAVMSYDGMVVNLERDILTNIKDGRQEGDVWMPHLERFLTLFDQTVLPEDAWYFDGRYVYSFPSNLLETLQTSSEASPIMDILSRDGIFRTGLVNSIDLYEIDEYRSKYLVQEQRGVMAISINGGEQFAVSPPVWKNVEAIGSSAMVEVNSATDHEEFRDRSDGVTVGEERKAQLIDLLDDKFSLNLNFTINTAKSISDHFGYDTIDPLQLPEIILALKTVNIPSLPKEIKTTFSIGLQPSHALLWLLGLINKAEDIDSFLAVKAALKYLTTKGMFHKQTTRSDTLFVGNEYKLPPLVSYRPE